MLQGYKAPCELLCAEKPELISEIHEAYLQAGADIIETCSFNATAISLAEFDLQDRAYELSAAAARLAKNAAMKFSTADKPRFVAGNMGPTSKSASLALDMERPEKRAVTWDELEAAYYDNARGLLDGGADIFLIETIVDSVNAKAAICAVKRLEEERGIELPIMLSATVMEKGGRLLSGQTIEAFTVSVSHADPLSLGLNCSFGAEKLKPHIAVFSRKPGDVKNPLFRENLFIPPLVSAYPNAGFPNLDGEYDQSPGEMADYIEEYFKEGLVNIAGGCCGSTPAHIAAIAERARNYPPRQAVNSNKLNLVSGLEAWDLSKLEINVLFNDELTGKINSGDYEGAVEFAMEEENTGRGFLSIRTDGLSIDGIRIFFNHALQYTGLARLPVMLYSDSADLSSMEIIKAGLKCLPGMSIIKIKNLKNTDPDYDRWKKLASTYGALLYT